VADDFIGTLIVAGEGWGAIGVVLVGLCGALAISTRGPAWGESSRGSRALA